MLAPGGDASSAGEEAAQKKKAMPLSGHWLRDQSMAFAATLLGTLDVSFEPRSEACLKVLVEGDGLTRIQQGLVSDSTLLLIRSIHQDYLCETRLVKSYGLHKLAKRAEELERVVSAAKEELEKRDDTPINTPIWDMQKEQAGSVADSLNRLLIWHAAYLLKHRPISARQFLKWFRDVVPNVVPNAVEDKALGQDARLGKVVNEALKKSRDPNTPIWKRLQRIDTLYKTVLGAIGGRGETAAAVWWTRICMAYRSSLFCWPLLTVGKQRRGLSLPVFLHVNEDGQSSGGDSSTPEDQRIHVKYDLMRPEQIRFLGFGKDKDWEKAFAVGLHAAKMLWKSQNRRSGHEDSAAYNRKLTGSLDVELGAACEIVASIYSRVGDNALQGFDKPGDNVFFELKDRSAEAYWVQCVLSLLLPRHEVPMGVCTGTIEHDEEQREFKTQGVAAVVSKLEYANRAGIPRVVIPGEYDDDGEGTPHHKGNDDKEELKDFLRMLDEKGTLAVDFARNAREAADMIQSSGWRHSIFMRTHRFRSASDKTKSRLYYRDACEDPKRREKLTKRQLKWYQKHPWMDDETGQLERLDRFFLSCGNAICCVKGDQLSQWDPNASSEDILGKWAAWRDYQARTCKTNGNAGSGFSVLALRTAEGDSDLRLWVAVAQLLNADAADNDWEEKFRYSDLEGAATLLAQLICEPNAISQNSFGSGPDLLLIFDDAGMTQRGHPVFPTMFEHALSALLNPGGALDNALKDRKAAASGRLLRIIVVQEPQQTKPQKDILLKKKDRAILERLSIFRFGFSQHAAFTMANFDRDVGMWMHRDEFDRAVKWLRNKDLITTYRNILQLTPKARRCLEKNVASGDGPEEFMKERWWWFARAHRQAACALCPILHPTGFRITTGRDGQLEPENMLEAQWHLQRAYTLVPPRFRSRWMDNKNDMPMPGDSQILLAYLHATQDWDTALILRTNYKARRDAIELGDHLLKKIQDSKNVQGSFSVNTGRAIEGRGHFFKYGGHELLEDQKKIESACEIDKIVEMCQKADAQLDTDETKTTGISPDELRRRRRHLYSRQLFALRMLGVPFNDDRMKEAKSCIDQTVKEIMEPDFLDRIWEGGEGLDDFPIPKNCWRALWLDGKDEETPNKTLSRFRRSEYAYAAVRANLEKFREGQRWEEPWIAYFVLMGKNSIDPAQIAEVLNLWWAFYVEKLEDPCGFGLRVLNLQPHMRKDNDRNAWVEVWSRDINQAIRNVWHYLMDAPNPDDPNDRLCGKQTAAALRLINVLVLPETLPAFNFLKVCGEHWLEHWPNLILNPVEAWPSPAKDACGDTVAVKEWKALATSVVGHMAGWVAMLTNLKSVPNKKVRLGYVFRWLKALEAIAKHADEKNGGFSLKHADPENLLVNAKSMALVKKGGYISALRCATDVMDNILGLKNDRGWAFSGHFRQQLNTIKKALSEHLRQHERALSISNNTRN